MDKRHLGPVFRERLKVVLGRFAGNQAEFARSIGENSVHGSDAPETAAEEIKFFFTDAEIVG